MILEKEIIAWNNFNGLTDDLVNVISLNESDFPRLIFQDFMNQLKISKIQIGFELNTVKLIEVEPQDLEQIDEHLFATIKLGKVLNKLDLLSYYLLTRVLKTEFNTDSIYTDNKIISKFYFESQIPFSGVNTDNHQFPKIIKKLLNDSKPKEIEYLIERFFILMGKQYQDKLILFLTYLDTKYKFKMNKSSFIDSTLSVGVLNQVKSELIKNIKKYA